MKTTLLFWMLLAATVCWALGIGFLAVGLVLYFCP